MNKVTIIITCYNQREYIAEAIQSALDQTVPCDIVVVDDGSSDGSGDVIMQFPVTYIRQSNKGVSEARNTAIRCSNTEYIFPLDGDDKIDPSTIEKCLLAEEDIVGTGMQTFGDYESTTLFKEYPNLEDFKVYNSVTCSALFKKSMWQEVGGYDSAVHGYEDWDLWLRLANLGYTFRVIQEPLLFYRKHGISLVNTGTANHSKYLEYMLAKIS